MSEKTCDCGNPDCTLPAGRCSLCAEPCLARGPGTEVCGRCIVSVRALYDVECQTLNGVGPNPEGPGWFLVDECEDGSGLIVRDDGQTVFEGDEDAAQHVVTKLTLKQLTPAVVSMLSLEEAEDIRAALEAAFPDLSAKDAIAHLLSSYVELVTLKLAGSDALPPR